MLHPSLPISSMAMPGWCRLRKLQPSEFAVESPNIEIRKRTTSGGEGGKPGVNKGEPLDDAEGDPAARPSAYVECTTRNTASATAAGTMNSGRLKGTPWRRMGCSKNRYEAIAIANVTAKRRACRAKPCRCARSLVRNTFTGQCHR